MRRAIEDTLRSQNGAIFAQPALVGRGTYTGRDIIARNSKFEPGYQDERGYVLVEWWIMSITPAGNPERKENEGISRLLLKDGRAVLLTEAASAAEDLLFKEYRVKWPLVKVLDIGGEPVVPSFGGPPEVPPIPFHVHSGEIRNGRPCRPGKLEAYLFPPVDVPPYRRQMERVISRLGLKPGTQKDEFLAALREFGVSDAMYQLGAVYEVRPYEGWTIRPGCLHAPGPWPTIEIQLPQDDANFASWRLGARLSGSEREKLWQEWVLQGLKDEEEFLQQVVNWDLSVDPEFEQKFKRKAREIESGGWGRRLQIFFDEFYGEALELESGCCYTRRAEETPWAGVVWSGQGKLNGITIKTLNEGGLTEFLVAPGHEAEFVNEGETRLIVYSAFPIRA